MHLTNTLSILLILLVIGKYLDLKYRELQTHCSKLTCSIPNAKNIKKVFNVIYKYAMRNGYIKENTMRLVTLNIQGY